MTDHEIAVNLAHVYNDKSAYLTSPEKEAILLAMVYIRQKIQRRKRGTK